MDREVKQETDGPSDVLIPGLPDEIAIFCIARVPRSYHRTMSSVCHSWRNLVQGTVFSKLRQDLSLGEEWLYLWTGNMWRCFDSTTQTWSKLPLMPNNNRICDQKSFGSLDGKLFAVGGHIPSPNHFDEVKGFCKTVTYFDARRYCWKRVADLNIARTLSFVKVIDNKLYAFGGFTGGFRSHTSTAEVYDPMTDTWKFISSLKPSISLLSGETMGGRLYTLGHKLGQEELEGFVYDPQTDQWEDMADGLSGGWRAQSTFLNGKFYTAGNQYVAGQLEAGYVRTIDQVIQAYNPSKNVWEVLEEIWWRGAHISVMDEIGLVTFCGKLCIVSVDRDSDYIGEESYSTIEMVMLEVNDSNAGPACKATFRDKSYERFGEGKVPWATGNDLQTITL